MRSAFSAASDGGPVPTPSQTAGPYLALGFEPLARTALVPEDAPRAVRIGGRVLDGSGAPVPDAVVELWQADPDGRLLPEDAAQRFGRCLTDAEGRWAFRTVKPGPVPLATGELQAPHLELLVFARGLLRPVRTRSYFPDEAGANAADPVLRRVAEDRRATLVAVEDQDEGGLRFDVRLQGRDETVFFAC